MSACTCVIMFHVDAISTIFVLFSVDGFWSSWSQWTGCSVTCGGGIHYRQRSCDGPKYGGKSCDEDNQDEDDEVCNSEPCPSTYEAKILRFFKY